MLASHYVFQSLLLDWDKDEKVKAEFRSFLLRYPKDAELQELAKEFDEYLKARDTEKKQKLKEELLNLVNVRRIESSGGTQLPFKDRRHLGEHPGSR